ncbi:alpha-L-fucosidase [Roseivirga sp. E12]|uniref:alpha-L-fucosidase n=1 Tax=Roseivirga sp. E12 TaxID=2819237 RepID=UPI001ABC6363|nr:alpha-L-fucosidase [Roseivirga sp. E12]
MAMKRGLFTTLVSIVLAMLFSFSLSAQKQYAADWDDLKSRPYPQWFKDAKLGVFIHWGVYSVPAYSNKEDYGEWYLRGLMLGDSLRTSYMRTHYGEEFTYRDFAPLFKARLFYPDEWADLFKRAGAKYVVMVSKHHDGYALWSSKYAPKWNSMEVGPKRDLVGELTTSVKKAGLHMGLYYSLPEWNNPLHRWDTDPDRNIGPYVEKHMIPQFKELISTYKPDLIFADGEWNNTAKEWHSAELISWYFNLMGDNAVVNDRWGAGSQGMGFLTPEYSAGIKATDRPWAEVRGLGRSFGLNRFEKLDAYMTSEELIHFFIKAVANGGGVTINVGPTADGQIPLLQQDRLVQLGNWIQINDEAIYGSTVWKKTGEEKRVNLSRVDPNIDFNWVRNGPGNPIKEDDFTAIWTGFIAPEFSETYQFEVQADDGIRVWINDQLIINSWKNAPEGANGFVMGSNTTSSVTNSIELKAGERYQIRVEYFEGKQNASARLFWSSASLEKQIVRSSRLYTTAEGEVHGLNAIYSSMQQHIAYTLNNENVYAITMEWPDDELVLNIDQPNRAAKVNLLGYEGELDWSYANGKMKINTDDIKFSQLKSKDAWVFKITNF